MNGALCFISVLCSFCASFCHGLILGGSLGINIDLLKQQNPQCNTTHIRCFCGFSTILFEMPQCTKFHRFRTKCAPCNGMTAEKICPIFENCQECSSQNGGRCSKCPTHRYGEFCENQCQCQNGGHCTNKGACICAIGFEGRYCEEKLGCDLPTSAEEPMKTEMHPPGKPATIIYSCPYEYELMGPTLISCLVDGQWSGPVPKCLKKCPTLNQPAKGYLKFNDTSLIQGTTAEVTCYENHIVIGQNYLTCGIDGNWDQQLPRCVEASMCRDPGEVRYASKSVSSAAISSVYQQQAVVRFACDQGFLLFGPERIVCTSNGSWDQELPSCLKASSTSAECNSTGSDFVSVLGVPVRILCPPECAKQAKIYGTSIYHINSSVCAAAVHSGKLTNSGGIVEIINNGAYSHFAGSYINTIQSQSFEGRDESFRFDKVQSTKHLGRCSKGVQLINELCLFTSQVPLTKNDAEATCRNLGFQLHSLDPNTDQLIPLFQKKGILKVWTGTASPNNTAGDDRTHVSEETECESYTLKQSQLVQSFEDCDQKLPFICEENETSNRLVACRDPGHLVNGKITAVGKVDDTFYVGSSIQYYCEVLHYLKGATNIHCQANGTWSDEKPVCIKVITCEDPLVPYGGYVNYLAPVKNPMSQRQAIIPTRVGPRAARLPTGLQVRPPSQVSSSSSTTTAPPVPEIEIPAGRQRVGTRAMYDCESRYYNLVGSRSRRCEKEGQWSGRPPTCIPICGRSDSSRSPFIVNGNASDIGQWPWQAGIARYLQDYDLWYVLCGGSLLNERWVITAAHCVTYTGTTLPIDPDKFKIYIGKYHRSDTKDDEYVQIKLIRELHVHADYEPQIFDSDIALLQLDTPVQLNSRVQPVCLPTEHGSRVHLSPGTKGVVTGWGTNENGTHSDSLQQAVVPVVSNSDCEEGYESAGMPLTVTENMFCAGYKEGRVDSCSGDSGGPFVFLDGSSKQRRWVLEGIVSWGSPTGCGNADQYGGYTKVSNYLDWIHLFF